MNEQLKEFKDYEVTYFKLPKWYKGWCLANQTSIKIVPPEYVYQALKNRSQLLNILESKE
jgi:hypothetical protein